MFKIDLIVLKMSYKDKKKSNVFKSKEGYNLYASEYDKTLGHLGSFEKDFLLRILGKIKVERALDLGCGTGRLVPILKKSADMIVAADVSEEMLKIVKEKFPKVETALTDINDLSFNADYFDLVIAGFLIVHVRDLEVAFDEVYRVLKDGGYFILTNVNQKKAPKLETGTGGEIVIESHYHRPVDVIEALERSLFKVEKEEFVNENGVWINQIVVARK